MRWCGSASPSDSASRSRYRGSRRLEYAAHSAHLWRALRFVTGHSHFEWDVDRYPGAEAALIADAHRERHAVAGELRCSQQLRAVLAFAEDRLERLEIRRV